MMKRLMFPSFWGGTTSSVNIDPFGGPIWRLRAGFLDAARSHGSSGRCQPSLTQWGGPSATPWPSSYDSSWQRQINGGEGSRLKDTFKFTNSYVGIFRHRSRVRSHTSIMGHNVVLLPGPQRKGSGQYFSTKLSGHHEVSMLSRFVHYLGPRTQFEKLANLGPDPLLQPCRKLAFSMARRGGCVGQEGRAHVGKGLPMCPWPLGTLQAQPLVCEVRNGRASHSTPAEGAGFWPDFRQNL